MAQPGHNYICICGHYPYARVGYTADRPRRILKKFANEYGPDHSCILVFTSTKYRDIDKAFHAHFRRRYHINNMYEKDDIEDFIAFFHAQDPTMTSFYVDYGGDKYHEPLPRLQVYREEHHDMLT